MKKIQNININDIPISACSSDLSESEKSLDDSSLTENNKEKDDEKDEEKENSIISRIPKLEDNSFNFFDEKSLENEVFLNIIKVLESPKEKEEEKEEKKVLDINKAKTDASTKTKNKEKKFIKKTKKKYFLNKKRKEE